MNDLQPSDRAKGEGLPLLDTPGLRPGIAPRSRRAKVSPVQTMTMGP